MWIAEDKQVAEKAAQTLCSLQGRIGPDVLQKLKEICSQVANKRNDEHERAEAWLSICRLAECFEKNPNAEEIGGLWHRAIQATNAWRGSMK